MLGHSGATVTYGAIYRASRGDYVSTCSISSQNKQYHVRVRRSPGPNNHESYEKLQVSALVVASVAQLPTSIFISLVLTIL